MEKYVTQLQLMDKSVYLGVDDATKLKWKAIESDNNTEVVALALENLKTKVDELRTGRHRAENNVNAITKELERLKILLGKNYNGVRDIDNLGVKGPKVAATFPQGASPLNSVKNVSENLGHQLASLRKVVESLEVPVVKARKMQQVAKNGPAIRKTGKVNVKRETKRKVVTATHYHINLAHVPFLLSNNVNPSHSSVAAIQQLVATLKLHNNLCTNAFEGLKNQNTCGKHEDGDRREQEAAANLTLKIQDKCKEIQKIRQLQEELSKGSSRTRREKAKQEIAPRIPRTPQKARPSSLNLMRRAKIINALISASEKELLIDRDAR